MESLIIFGSVHTHLSCFVNCTKIMVHVHNSGALVTSTQYWYKVHTSSVTILYSSVYADIWVFQVMIQNISWLEWMRSNMGFLLHSSTEFARAFTRDLNMFSIYVDGFSTNLTSSLTGEQWQVVLPMMSVLYHKMASYNTHPSIAETGNLCNGKSCWFDKQYSQQTLRSGGAWTHYYEYVKLMVTMDRMRVQIHLSNPFKVEVACNV